MANPLSASRVSPSSNLNLDAGIGDYDANGNFQLVNLTSGNLHLQYHLPSDWATFIDVGVGHLHSNNMNGLTPSAGLASGGRLPYNRESAAFFNLFHNLNEQFRVGVEYAHMQTVYSDGSVGANNRYQMTTQFIF